MSGHSKWSTIKHKKGAADAKRGKIFSKLAKAITSAARQGGGNPDMNLKLQYAIDSAKSENMPKDNIERAILKGTGELGAGTILYECLYEGYGSNGIAVLVEILTDNKNRTASEIRKIFERGGGNLGESGCVSWMFQKKGLITIGISEIDEDKLMALVLDAGCEDLQIEDGKYQIDCETKDFNSVKKMLQDEGIKIELAEISWIPNTLIELDKAKGRSVISFMEKLENHDDVQCVYANLSLSQDIMDEL
ncbi:MAG: YebC/PmpR family DNA-binding transcriptional regulator [Candidatus Brocadiaceae bacterium]|nr:YebC/PmpR family DNA-binding transcriptional regulator [Candidatus Brocadiaceae bacterium]